MKTKIHYLGIIYICFPIKCVLVLFVMSNQVDCGLVGSSSSGSVGGGSHMRRARGMVLDGLQCLASSIPLQLGVREVDDGVL